MTCQYIWKYVHAKVWLVNMFMAMEHIPNSLACPWNVYHIPWHANGHHEKLLIPATGIQFIPVLHTGIWHARENKFHTRESLFIFPCAPREYEYWIVHTEIGIAYTEYELYNWCTREYWIKVNLVFVPHTRLERTPSTFCEFCGAKRIQVCHASSLHDWFSFDGSTVQTN